MNRTRTPYTPTGRRYDQRKSALQAAPVYLSALIAILVLVAAGVLVSRAFTSVQHDLDDRMHPTSTVQQ